MGYTSHRGSGIRCYKSSSTASVLFSRRRTLLCTCGQCDESFVILLTNVDEISMSDDSDASLDVVKNYCKKSNEWCTDFKVERFLGFPVQDTG